MFQAIAFVKILAEFPIFKLHDARVAWMLKEFKQEPVKLSKEKQYG